MIAIRHHQHKTPEGGLVKDTHDSVAVLDTSLAHVFPGSLKTKATVSTEPTVSTDPGFKSLSQLQTFAGITDSTEVLNETLVSAEMAEPLMTLWVDAAVLGNGTDHAEGFIAVLGDNGVLVDEPVGRVTNNEGEILAIKRALLIAGDDRALVYSDSLIAVNLITRRWRGRAPNLKALIKDVRLPKHIELLWTPREENRAGHYLETAYGA